MPLPRAILLALLALCAVVSAQVIVSPDSAACFSSLDQLSSAQASLLEGCLAQSFASTDSQCVESCMTFTLAQQVQLCDPASQQPVRLCASDCLAYQQTCGATLDCSVFSQDSAACVAPQSSFSDFVDWSTSASSDQEDPDGDSQSRSDFGPFRPHRRPDSGSDEASDSDAESDRPPHRARPLSGSDAESDRPPHRARPLSGSDAESDRPPHRARPLSGSDAESDRPPHRARPVSGSDASANGNRPRPGQRPSRPFPGQRAENQRANDANGREHQPKKHDFDGKHRGFDASDAGSLASSMLLILAAAAVAVLF